MSEWQTLGYTSGPIETVTDWDGNEVRHTLQTFSGVLTFYRPPGTRREMRKSITRLARLFRSEPVRAMHAQYHARRRNRRRNRRRK